MMKKLSTILLAFVLIVFMAGVYPQMALAAWIATDDFSSGYTDDTSVDGIDGGTNWDAWAASENKYTAETVTALDGHSQYGVYAVILSTDASVNRTITSTQTTGVFRMFVRRTDKTLGRQTFGLHNASDRMWFFRMGTADIIFTDGPTIVSSYNVNQWYKLDISFNTDTDLAKARVDCGDWSADTGAETVGGAISFFRMNATESGTGIFYFDDFADGDDCAVASADAEPFRELIFFYNEV